MTRADYIALERVVLGDTSADADKITQALNWTVNDLFTSNRLRLAEASDDLFAATGEYEMDLPDDIDKIIPEGFYVVTPQVARMDSIKMNYEELMQEFPGYKTYPNGQLRHWAIYGATIRFSNPLDADYAFTLDYLRNPVDVVNDTDVLEIPDKYSELILLSTKARYLEMDEEYDDAIDVRTNIEPLRLNFIRNEGRGQAQTGGYVMRTGRGRRE